RSLKWHRLIVDEAHALKNHTSKVFEAVYSIDAEFRWLLSATLLLNGPDEIFSYLKLLRLPGTETRRKFNKEYGLVKYKVANREPTPLKESSQSGEDSARLDEILSCLVLQRTENTKYFGVRTVNIPPSTDCKFPVSYHLATPNFC